MYIIAHYLQVLENIVTDSSLIYFIIINLINPTELSMVLGQIIPLFRCFFLSLPPFFFFND